MKNDFRYRSSVNGFILFFVIFALFSCKPRILNSKLSEEPQSSENSSQGFSYDTVYQKSAQVVGLALAEYVKTGKTPDTKTFLYEKAKERGLTQKEFNQFEDLVLDFYGKNNPKTCSNETFMNGLKLSVEEAGWIRTYYNFEDLSLVKGEGVGFVQSAIQYAKYENNRGEFDAIRTDLFRMSIQQMADARGMSVSDLRFKLWQYNISLVSMWQTIKEPGDGDRSLLVAALEKLQSGLSNDDVAKQLNISVVALENILHFLRYENYARSWTDREVNKLRIMWGKISIKEIAIILGRSEDSVSYKARYENLTNPGISPRRLILPEFSDLDRIDIEKRYELIESFLASTLDLSAADLADMLDVTEETIKKWRDRFNFRYGKEKLIALETERVNNRRTNFSQKLMDRFEMQEKLIAKEIEIWQREREHVTQANCPEKLGVSHKAYVQNGKIFMSNIDRLIELGKWVLQNPDEYELIWGKTIQKPDLSDVGTKCSGIYWWEYRTTFGFIFVKSF